MARQEAERERTRKAAGYSNLLHLQKKKREKKGKKITLYTSFLFLYRGIYSRIWVVCYKGPWNLGGVLRCGNAPECARVCPRVCEVSRTHTGGRQRLLNTPDWTCDLWLARNSSPLAQCSNDVTYRYSLSLFMPFLYSCMCGSCYSIFLSTSYLSVLYTCIISTLI